MPNRRSKMANNSKEEYPQPPIPENSSADSEKRNEDSEELEFSAAQPKHVTVTDIELRQLKKEANEYKDKYLRLLADMENSRKRLQKEKQEIMQYAVENSIVEFLHPLDNLENALNMAQQMSSEVKNWAVGFQMILAQFKDVLAQHRVIPITSKGQHFDPYAHEAVEVVETDEFAPGTVIEEFVKGYKMGDRVIRPARVKVSKALQKGSEDVNQK